METVIIQPWRVSLWWLDFILSPSRGGDRAFDRVHDNYCSLDARRHGMQVLHGGGVDQGSILGRLRGDERGDPESSV